jgi:hypothetical protein
MRLALIAPKLSKKNFFFKNKLQRNIQLNNAKERAKISLHVSFSTLREYFATFGK